MPEPTTRGPYPHPRLRIARARHEHEPVADELYHRIGSLLGVFGAWVAFFGAYSTAINSTGWLMGLALGWTTAWLAAAVAFVILRRLWPFMVVLLIALLH
jgi:hypothetical protein